MYDELVKWLRYCSNSDAVCDLENECPYHRQEENETGNYYCAERMMAKAADAIVELLAFARFVAKEICVSDERWEESHWALQEIFCRKLVNLGVLVEEGGNYWFEEDEEDDDG